MTNRCKLHLLTDYLITTEDLMLKVDTELKCPQNPSQGMNLATSFTFQIY